MKNCSKCKAILNDSGFVPNKSVKSGLSSWCRVCISKYNRSEENKIKARERSKAFRIKKGLKPLSLRQKEMKELKKEACNSLTCSFCKVKKDVSNFLKRKNREFSFCSYCRCCTNKKSNKRVAESKKPSPFDAWSLEQKRSARIKTSNAISSGKLIKEPCFICGSKKSQAHHKDYDKPLQITWLCSKHHGEAHRRYE